MPTVTLHSGLFNSKSTAEPATKVPIHAHQPTNSALPKLMSVNILGFIGDDQRSHACTSRSRHHFTAVEARDRCSSGWACVEKATSWRTAGSREGGPTSTCTLS